MYRFKTGTPARIDKRSIDFSKMEEQFGDERVVPFSFTTDPEDVQIEQASCWLTYTNPDNPTRSSVNPAVYLTLFRYDRRHRDHAIVRLSRTKL